MRRGIPAGVIVGVLSIALSSASVARADGWTKTGSLGAARNEATAFSPGAGRVVVVSPGTITAVEWTDASASFSPIPAPYFHMSRDAVRLDDGTFVIAAGNVGQVFSGSTWSPSLSATAGNRRGHRLVRLTSGKVLAIGGSEGLTDAVAACRLYDPVAGTWSDAAPMGSARAKHAAIRLPDGRVLVAGGVDASGAARKSAEIYDPGTNAWSPVADMGAARKGHALLPLADGKVIAIGGNVSDGTTDVFDPGTDGWSAGAVILASREAAAYAPTGERWLIIGGAGADGSALSTVEIFDPAAKTFVAGPPMFEARASHFAAVLADGKVLVGGGVTKLTGGTDLKTAELFVPSVAPDAGADSGDATSDASPDSTTTDTATGDAASDSASDSASDVAPDAGAPSGPPRVDGAFQRCSTGAECATGFCVEGVCCNEACAKSCHSCALPWAPGVCTQEPAGVDLRNECGAALSCLGTCGPAGSCIGAGPGTTCARSQCTGRSTGVGAAVCEAAGAACEPDDAVPFDCGPFACAPAFGACFTLCTTSDECAEGFACDVGARTCVPTASAAEDEGCTVSSVTSSGGSSGGASRGLAALAAVLGLGLVARRRRRQREARRTRPGT